MYGLPVFVQGLLADDIGKMSSSWILTLEMLMSSFGSLMLREHSVGLCWGSLGSTPSHHVDIMPFPVSKNTGIEAEIDPCNFIDARFNATQMLPWNNSLTKTCALTNGNCNNFLEWNFSLHDASCRIFSRFLISSSFQWLAEQQDMYALVVRHLKISVSSVFDSIMSVSRQGKSHIQPHMLMMQFLHLYMYVYNRWQHLTQWQEAIKGMQVSHTEIFEYFHLAPNLALVHSGTQHLASITSILIGSQIFFSH